MEALELVRLESLMSRGQGRRGLRVALIDGPVAIDLPDFGQATIELISAAGGSCSRPNSAACMHGTFVAGMLVARRGAQAPAICPGSTLLVRPIFTEDNKDNRQMPSATPEELATAIVDAIGAAANVINLSAAITNRSLRGNRQLEQALDYAARRGVLVVAAAGNQGTVGSSAITRHPWVIPVIACDSQGGPTAESNLGGSIGRWGLAAPGEDIVSLGTDGKPQMSAGTSVAAPFVTGAIALLWSEFPSASAVQIKLALTQTVRPPRRSIAPPLLDAWAAYGALSSQGRLAHEEAESIAT
jgi:subtilisin family serine protease